MSHINIELKARCSSHDLIRNILKSKNADFKGTERQIDTYFKVNHGRLKLREGNIENFLIYYDRENKKGPKQFDSSFDKSTKFKISFFAHPRYERKACVLRTDS